MRTFSTAILYTAIFCPSAFADTSLRGQSVPLENDASRAEQDFSLLTDLKIKPTAVDVAMLQTLLGSLGALFGRSLSDADSLDHALPADIDDEDNSVETIDKERVVYDTAAVITSAKALIAGPATAALLAGPAVTSLLSVAKIVAAHPLVAISALLGLAPLILGPALKLILAGPALLPALGLLKALNLGKSWAAPVIAGAAFAALVVGPAVGVILHGIGKLVGTMKSLLPVLIPLLMSGPFGGLLAALAPLLSPLFGALSAVLTGPAVTSFVALIKVLLSGTTINPLERGFRALPLKLATAVAEANERPASSRYNAFDLLNSQKNLIYWTN
ncbi:MAG: uncharacterized protein KVP18_004779 [Porospora cf. gigantea A]|uniref:uncharacterized protein n=1 Tax=Porospora cf. gigantea A TaxID=2853593 RepID=UPI00355981B8|nr:MAG: hypothetical protein KVP18_004779 [Porospora cf. gigantea A]